MGIWKIRWFGTVLFCAGAILSCSGGGDRNLIEGTYVNSAGGKFSVADDTLVVEHLGGRHYAVHRRTGFHLVVDGLVGVRQFEREEWKAVQDDVDAKVLLELRWGKILTFSKYNEVLEVGRRVYMRLE